MTPVSRCGLRPPIRSTYTSGTADCAGSGVDQTRHAVPVPRKSSTWTELCWSAVGHTPITVGADQLLPDWLNHAVTPWAPTYSTSAVPVPSMSASRIRRGSNRSSSSNRGAAVHRHLRAEPPVADVRPVARLAVAHPDDVGEAVPGHVGGEDRLRPVGEDDRRGFLLVPAGADLLGVAEAGPGRASRETCTSVLGDEDVREPVAGHVDEPDVRIRPVDCGQRGELPQRLELPIGGALEVARDGLIERHHVEPPAARQVEQPDARGWRQARDGREATVSSGPKRARTAEPPSGCGTRLAALRFRL